MKDGPETYEVNEHMDDQLSRSERSLPVVLSDAEVLRAGDDLAHLIEDIEAEENHAKQVRAELKETMARLVARRSKLVAKVTRREERRPVMVETWLCSDAMVRTVRVDTDELLEIRAATEDELQPELPEDEPQGGAEDAADGEQGA